MRGRVSPRRGKKKKRLYLSVVIQRPLFIFYDDLRGSPIKVVLPQRFIPDPRRLLTHPVSRSTHGSPEGLCLPSAQLVRPRLLAIRLTEIYVLRRLVVEGELEFVFDWFWLA